MTSPKSVEKATELAKEFNEQIRINKELRDRWLGVYIGVIALFLAICTMLGNNATKDAARFNIEASNAWSFFQAKNLRRQIIRLQIDQLDLDLAGNPSMPEAARKAYAKKIEDYRALDKVLTSDLERKEGLDELFAKAKGLEAERDLALKQDPYYDWAQTFLQIAIVLASVCLITGTMWLLYLSGGLGLLGVLLLANGYTLAVKLPFLGG